MSSPNDLGEGVILPPPPVLRRHLVRYRVVLTGEVAGSVLFSGAVWRAAKSREDALSEVHTYLVKCPLLMYPVAREGGGAELVTPEFPPEFSGRPLKSVQVWIDDTLPGPLAK